MNNIIRTKTTETPITNLWNKFRNVILIAHRDITYQPQQHQRDSVNHGSIRNVNELYEKRSDDIETLNKLKNKKIGKIFKKQQGMQDQHTIMLTQNTYVKQNFIENNDSKKNKKFYSFIKAKRSDIGGVSRVVDSEGVTYINDKKLSELLKLVSATFYQIFIFNQTIALQKL